MAVSFGDFKLNEISKLIRNKDPLGLNTDVEHYSTIKKKSEAPLNTPDANRATNAEESKKEYDVILHYLKFKNLNNNKSYNTITKGTCWSNNLLYCLECNWCHIKYVGQKIESLIDSKITYFTLNTITTPQWQDTFTATVTTWILTWPYT